MSRPKHLTIFLLVTVLFTACGTVPATPTPYPAYDPFSPVNGNSVVPATVQSGQVIGPTSAHSGPTPTRAPVSVEIPHRNPNPFLFEPTPDSPHPLPTPRGRIELYSETIADFGAVSEPTARDKIAAMSIGFFGGLNVGLTSVGTGVFFGLSLLILWPIKSSKVVGTDIFHAAALLWVAGAGHFVAGNVDISAVLWLLLGSIPGVLLGSHVARTLPSRTMRFVLAAVLLVAGVKLV